MVLYEKTSNFTSEFDEIAFYADETPPELMIFKKISSQRPFIVFQISEIPISSYTWSKDFNVHINELDTMNQMSEKWAIDD